MQRRKRFACSRGMVWLRRLLMLHMSAASTRTIAGAGTRQGARVLNAYLTNDPGECGA